MSFSLVVSILELWCASKAPVCTDLPFIDIHWNIQSITKYGGNNFDYHFLLTWEKVLLRQQRKILPTLSNSHGTKTNFSIFQSTVILRGKSTQFLPLKGNNGTPSHLPDPRRLSVNWSMNDDLEQWSNSGPSSPCGWNNVSCKKYTS